MVALRELTTDGNFDDIIRDEFQEIPSDIARDAYVYVAALGQLDLSIRYETLVRLLDLRYDQLGREIFTPTEGILISCEESGSSRHNAGFRLRTRHPIIASVIFALSAPDDDVKFEVVNRLLTQMDPGFPEDRMLLEAIARRRELVETFVSEDNRRAVYDRLATIVPNNKYVLQHRSILEKDLGCPTQAIEYARQALKLDRENPVLLNTLGLALESAARDAADPLRRQALRSEAAKLFEDGIRRDQSDPYGYLGKFYLLKQTFCEEREADRKSLLQARMLSLLEEAFEATGESAVIVAQLAKQRDQLGDAEHAVSVLRDALEKDPTDTRLRDLWVRLEIQRGQEKEAMRIASEGVRFDPTSWRLQRHIARLLRQSNGCVQAIKGHYEAALRHRKVDVALTVELGAYLFINGLYAEAGTVFREARDLPVTTPEKRKVREWWKGADGKALVFDGKVKSIAGAAARAIAVPENFEAFFWRQGPPVSDLRVEDPIRFLVGFNAHGPVAQILQSA